LARNLLDPKIPAATARRAPITMLHSIEARAPFLDRDLSAFALALPVRAKVRGLEGKWILKRAARAWLPRAVVHRRKRGLSVPVAA